MDSDSGPQRSLKLPFPPPTGEGAGADEFLPLLSLVLAQCDLPELLLEAEYMSELLEPSLLTGEGEGPHTRHLPAWVGPAWPRVSRGGAREQVAHPQPELHPSPCVPGGYYLTSLSASLALLSGLGQARTLPLSPSQELQRALSLWEQRRLPATHSFQVTGPPRHPPNPRSGRGKAGPAIGTVPRAEQTAKPALLQRVRSTCRPRAQCSRGPALNLHRNAEIGPSLPPFYR